MSLSEYFRRPDGFMSIAVRTIRTKPLRSRCFPSPIQPQTWSNRTTSACLDAISGNARKCGRTRAFRSSSFRTSNFSVLIGTIRTDRPAIPHLHQDREQFGPLCVLADRKARPNLPNRIDVVDSAGTKRRSSPRHPRNPRCGPRAPFGVSGPASYGATALHPGISPLSRYGDHVDP